jgi:energy-coupling factor transport system substrate-specific component
VLVLIPFNQYHQEISGIAVRPAAVVPVVAGILRGPAAAWGLGIGNIAGDWFGGSCRRRQLFGLNNEGGIAASCPKSYNL